MTSALLHAEAPADDEEVDGVEAGRTRACTTPPSSTCPAYRPAARDLERNDPVTMPALNPFHHPDNPPPIGPANTELGEEGLAGASQVDMVERVDRVDQSWGVEEIFAVLDGHCVGKVLHIGAGQALPLQHHLSRDEIFAVQSGSITVELGADPAHLRTLVLDAGDRVRVRANVVHRIVALTDARVLKASTAPPGWRHDVVRHDDPGQKT